MVRASNATLCSRSCSPHPRGDGPRIQCENGAPPRFSPPAWGWSDISVLARSFRQVLPTRVGMVRSRARRWIGLESSPHPRGDGPCVSRLFSFRPLFSPPAWGWSALEGRVSRLKEFSPPAWGWSVSGARLRPPRRVLPTRVGMVRVQVYCQRVIPCSPHPRGDGPVHAFPSAFVIAFSPPAWGWSAGESP